MAGLIPKFNKSDITQMITDRIEKISKAVLERLKYIGEEFVINARQSRTYKDHTGNLRNSIGYIILQNGKQLFENFEKSATVEVAMANGKTALTTGSNDGISKGAEFAAEVATQHPRGFVLIVVAGMHYAAAVESRGYDVLTGSSAIADHDLKEALTGLMQKIGRIT